MNKEVFWLLFLSLLYICVVMLKDQYIVIEDKQSILWKVVILSSGLISVMTGIDKGESIYGFLRLFAYMTAAVAVQQLEEKDKQRILSIIPLLGVIFSVCSLFHECIIFQNWISMPTGRLAGPFEYPNTMALFLVIGLVVAEYLWKRGKYIIQIFLMIGVLATGCRTVFVILCTYLFYRSIKSFWRNKSFIILMIIVFLVMCMTVISGQGLYGLNRFMRLNIKESTFQGRLLYWEDAMRMLLKHPFGLGYMGYFYLQQAEQTGVYSVQFVHNEWLQWMLDYGIVAGVGLAMYIVRQFRQKKMEDMEKELLFVIAGCSSFDFHLQYTGIVLIVLLLFPRGDVICSGSQLLRWRYVCFAGALISAGFLSAAITAQQFARYQDYEHAVRWNPLSAQYKQELLLQSEDLDRAADYADQLLKDNQYLYVAYLIKSNAAAKEGKVDHFIENRKQVLRLRKYKVNEYEDYFRILMSWYLKACTENNDEVMSQCREAMQEIPEMIMEVKKQTSVRAYRIRQKPELNFNKEYEKVIRSL